MSNSSGLIILNFFTPTAGLDSPSMVTEWLHPTKRRDGPRLQVPEMWTLKYLWIGSFAKQKQILNDLEANGERYRQAVTMIELHPNGNCPSLLQVGRDRLSRLRVALHAQGLRLFTFFLVRHPVEWILHAFREHAPHRGALQKNCKFNTSSSQSENDSNLVECMLPNGQCSIAQSGWFGVTSLARRKVPLASPETCRSVLQLVQSEFDWFGAWEDRNLLRHELQALASPGEVSHIHVHNPPAAPSLEDPMDDPLGPSASPSTISALVAKADGDFTLYAAAYRRSRCERLRLSLDESSHPSSHPHHSAVSSSLTVAPPVHFPGSLDWNPHCKELTHLPGTLPRPRRRRLSRHLRQEQAGGPQ